MRSKLRSLHVISQPSVPFSPPTRTRRDFYREEFLKHRACLEQQREYYSERAIADFDCALQRILAQLDRLCDADDADGRVSALLKQFDLVTRLSAWIDPKTVH